MYRFCIREICSAIYEILQPDYMKLQSSLQEWEAVVDEGYPKLFWSYWRETYHTIEAKTFRILFL